MKKILLLVFVSGLFCCNSRQKIENSEKKITDILLELKKNRAKIDTVFKRKDKKIIPRKWQSLSYELLFVITKRENGELS